MAKRYVFTHEAYQYAKEMGASDLDLKRAEDSYNIHDHSSYSIDLDRYGICTCLELRLYRSDCCEQIDVEDPADNELFVMPPKTKAQTLYARVKKHFPELIGCLLGGWMIVLFLDLLFRIAEVGA